MKVAQWAAALAMACGLSIGAAHAQAKIEIIMTNEVAATHWKTSEMKQYADLLAKNSGGRITAKVFPASQLYNDRDAVGALGTGAVHITWPASVNLEAIDQRVGMLILPFVMAGTGMALVFAPAANAVLGAVRPQEAGQASGATNAIRELGGVLGVAVLATVFTANGSYTSPQAYVDGMTSAAWVGAAVLALGAIAALMVPGRKRSVELATNRPQVEAAA